MGRFFAGVLSVWVGKIIGAITLVVAAMIGYDYHDLAAFLAKDSPDYLSPESIRLAAAVLVLVNLWYLVIAPILRVWIFSRSERRDMSGEEVIDWLTNQSIWGRLTHVKYNVFGFVRDFAFEEFRRGAQEDDIEVRGCQNFNLPLEAIPRDYWQVLHLDQEDMAVGRTPGGRAAPLSRSSRIPAFGGLLIERRQIKKAWPRAPYWLRATMWAVVGVKHCFYVACLSA